MKNFIFLCFVAALLCACSRPAEQTANYRVVPLPADISLTADAAPFKMTSSTKIACANDSLTREAQFLQEYVKSLTGLDLKIDNAAEKDVIVLSADLQNDNPEAYQIDVTADKITVNGATSAGTFYGVQTLRKSIPEQIIPSIVAYPAATVSDMPRFAYRGTLLDVARHPMEVDSVKSFIDMIALHNINRLHWHLTDDQGWRLEIKKYPKLTELGSHRDGTMIEKQWGVYDSIPVDGFYTQEEAREIVKYAADRHITIIPEIDLPGHMIAALKGYPELGCTGGPYEIWKGWGVSEDLLCAGNDSIYPFLDEVLQEVCDIFPSELIHIGGDECPKIRWEKCAKCQAKIKELGLKKDAHSSAEDKLQTYVMSRAQETLARNGRRIIGWDEILEGGAPGDAIIMSWRGVNGAHVAAKSGHDAILTPNTYAYFDYLQSLDPSTEPVAIGGYLPVERVYSFEPIPAEFTPEEAAHIMGVQANLWREYIKTLSHSQYMELPRLAALSEVQWEMPANKEDYDVFVQRLQQLIKHYDALGYNYARHIYDVKGAPVGSADDDAIVVTLTTAVEQPIYYTLDGTEPNTESIPYTEPVKVKESGQLKAVAIDANGKPSHTYTLNSRIGKSSFKPYTLDNEAAKRYEGNPGALTDGILGCNVYSMPEWVGFNGKDVVATIDLGQPEEISSVTVTNLVYSVDWVYDARSIVVETSDDGKKFTTVAKEDIPALTEHKQGVETRTVKFDPTKAQYVKVTVGCEKSMPEWRGSGAGNPGYLFVDEITVD